jgi:DNA helicase-2/ATP-dependent DNA helicase PcrA
LSYNKVKNKDAIAILKIDERLKEILKSIHDKAKKLVDKEKDERAIIYRLDLINEKFLYGSSPFSFESDSGKELLKIVESQLKDGIVRFKDCFSLASWYLHNFPNVKEQLQHRFKYVFIDEMQDLEKYQIDIIDDIFFSKESKTIIQRIGDPNQSIYNKVKDECDWKPRNIKYLNGSNRLSSKNAELINCFTYRNEDEKFTVVGERKLLKDEKEIHPHLVLFKNETKEQLKSKFEEIIKSHNLHNIEGKKKGFKIIGWTGERKNEGDGNLCLHTIFGYNKLSKTKKEDFDSLSKYLQLFNQEKETLEAVRKSILNALIAILRYEDKKIEKKIRGRTVEHFYTKSDLINYIKDYSDNEIYADFKDKLYCWCFDSVSSRNHRLIFNSVKDFIENEFKDWFDLKLNHKTKLFIFEFNDEKKVKNKKIVEDDLGIEVATVHSVKGQTHCATMYVETAYKTPIYETLKLKEDSKNKSIKKQQTKTIPLFKQKQSCESPTGIEALKMMYVGFSRPTHLLCFAVLEENVKDDLEKFRNADWIINDDLIKIK